MRDRKCIIILCYDISNLTKKNGAEYRKFRKKILDEGFRMMQESIYICIEHNNLAAKEHINYMKKFIPKDSNVVFFTSSVNLFKSAIFLGKNKIDCNVLLDSVVYI